MTELDLDMMSQSELAELRTNLVSDIEAIQAQLGDPNRADPSTGERQGYVEYQAWRRGAMNALRAKKDLLRRVKSRMHESANESTWSLLARCHRFIEQVSLIQLDTLPDARTDIEEAAASLLDAIEDVVPRKYLREGQA